MQSSIDSSELTSDLDIQSDINSRSSFRMEKLKFDIGFVQFRG